MKKLTIQEKLDYLDSRLSTINKILDLIFYENKIDSLQAERFFRAKIVTNFIECDIEAGNEEEQFQAAIKYSLIGLGTTLK